MGGNDYGFSGIRKVCYYLPELKSCIGIKSRSRLIQYEYLRVMDEGSCKAQLLLSSTAQGIHVLILPVGKTYHIEKLLNAPFDLRLIHIVAFRKKIHVLYDAEIRVASGVIRNISYPSFKSADIGTGFHIIHHNHTLIGKIKTAHDLDRGGFTGSVGADETIHGAVFYVHGEAVKSIYMSICLFNILKGDHPEPLLPLFQWQEPPELFHRRLHFRQHPAEAVPLPPAAHLRFRYQVSDL